MESPETSIPSIWATGIRVPRAQALPWQISGSRLIRVFYTGPPEGNFLATRPITSTAAMKINNANTTPISKPVEATAPPKAAEPVRQETAPDSAPPQLSREEAADRSKARDTAARAQFAQRIEGGAELAQVSPRDQVKQGQELVDSIAANPERAVAQRKEDGEALDKLSKYIGGMNGDQAFSAVGELINLDFAVDNAKGAIERKLDFAPDSDKAGLQEVWKNLDRLDKAIDRAQHA